jgi:hypothetical protein
MMSLTAERVGVRAMLRMACNAVPFSRQLVARAVALGLNVVDNSRGGRQIGGTDCGSIAAFGLGRSW